MAKRHMKRYSISLIIGETQVNIYTMEYYSAIKKKEIRPFAAMWMDLDSVMLSEVSQTEKETNIIRHHLYVESRNDTNEFKYKTEKDLQT